MPRLPLRLSLEPIVPTRTPDAYDPIGFRLGYELRIPNGPIVDPGDPLLDAFAAEITYVQNTSEHEEQLQSESFDPGSRLSAVTESLDEDGDPVIGAWDEQQLRRAGEIPGSSAERVMAATEHGLETEIVVLEEVRAALDDRRVKLRILIHSPTLLRINPRRRPYLRPPRATRRRIVLLASGKEQFGWWDPSGSAGPAGISQLPVSGELRRELAQLGERYAALRARSENGPEGLEQIGLDWDRQSLTERSVQLWRRVRAELGREYAVGFLGPDMERPAWSPKELEGEDEGVWGVYE